MFNLSLFRQSPVTKLFGIIYQVAPENRVVVGMGCKRRISTTTLFSPATIHHWVNNLCANYTRKANGERFCADFQPVW